MSDPTPIEKAERRNPVGWLILAALFLFNIGSSLMRTEQRQDQGVKSWSQEQLQLSSGLELKNNPFGGAQGESTIREIREKARKAPPDDRMAARLRVVTSRTLKAEPAPEDLRFLRTSQKDAATKRAGRPLSAEELKGGQERDVADRALADGLSKSKLTKAEADRLVAKIPDNPFVFRLAKGLIREASGQGDAAAYAVPQAKIGKRIAAIVLMGLIGFSSVVAWIAFLVTRVLRTPPPPLVEADRPEGDYPRPQSVSFTGVRQGFPMPNMTATDADRLAIRAAQLFCGFFLIQILIAPFFRNLPEGAGTLASAVAMVAYVIAVSRLPIMGKPITLATLGLRGPGMPRLVGIGVFGFLLELPVSLGLGLLGAKIFSFLPAPEHPATNALFDTPSVLNILGILFFGAIVAPFWEEIMFRGALFPAVSRLAKSPVVGGIVSCFLFAAIHPQGLALWFALASVAGFSCALVRYSRNLWPSIVLHFCHNATLLVLQVLIT